MKTRSCAHSLVALALLSLAAAAGCGSDASDAGNENEVITTVTLTFTPSGGGTAVSAKVDDPDGDGGKPPVADPLTLAPGMYDVAVKFENRLETPPEDITEEVRDESAEHQVFFTGTAVNGPASNQPTAPLVHSYSDKDANDLPIGLTNRITASAGTGTLTVTLRHMPPVHGKPVKTASTADTVRGAGLSAVGGNTDAQVNFAATVR